MVVRNAYYVAMTYIDANGKFHTIRSGPAFFVTREDTDEQMIEAARVHAIEVILGNYIIPGLENCKVIGAAVEKFDYGAKE